MPLLHTTHFGDIDYDPGELVHFPNGLPAFENERQFLPVNRPPLAPVIFLQSAATPGLVFITLPVETIDPAYRLAVSPEDLHCLGASSTGQLTALAIVSISADRVATANLQAPVVIHPATRRAVQALLAGSGYSPQHALHAAQGGIHAGNPAPRG